MGNSQKGNDTSENKGFAQVSNFMQKSAAFRSLSASAIRVLLWATYRNFNAVSNKHRADSSRPCFKMTNAEALNKLGMPSPTFSRAKNELAEKGFLEWQTRGGLVGVNGVASEYRLSGAWKEWKPPITPRKDMSKARAVKKLLSKRA